ncbi:hypothetical protein TL16_g11676 [Triparma laevis f. inornata]|uniref:Low temperature viability protein n=1 Tax=Triparma laevis f. inornata TaxID=1714386 RepID=A0A9W7BN00_9STRA|nr:hypothetical protein TL16_g11676 [Triparma laevis f. inornata]
MGKSKKKFVDKNKSSTTFTLVHRSQRDIYDEDAINQPGVLIPTKHFVDSMGFLNDGYDYSQHIRTAQSGQITLPSGEKVNREDDVFSKPVKENVEVERMLESITLTNEGMDKDMADVLFGDDLFDVDGGEDGEGDLLDDFCEVAGKEELDKEELKERGYYASNGFGDFDYEAHIANLIEKSEQIRGGNVVFRGENVFEGVKRADGSSDDELDSDESGEFDDFGEDDEDMWGMTPVVDLGANNNDAEKERIAAVTEAYLQTLAEYDDEEIGALEFNAGGGGGDWIEEGSVGSEDDDEEQEQEQTQPQIIDDDVALLRDVETDTYVHSLLDDYLTAKKDEIFIEGIRKKKVGGSGFSALVNGKMRGGGDLLKGLEDDEEVTKIDINEELAAAMETLGRGVQKPPEEDVLIDGKSYFTVAESNPWDCESILSTYSNLDNNPVTIGGGRKKKKKKKKVVESIEEEEEQIIQLSEKTGLPLNVLEGKERKITGGGENKGVGRKKGETVEEKKARKQAVKEERERRRIEKKNNSVLFDEEIVKRKGKAGDDLKGKSVFKYA